LPNPVPSHFNPEDERVTFWGTPSSEPELGAATYLLCRTFRKFSRGGRKTEVRYVHPSFFSNYQTALNRTEFLRVIETAKKKGKDIPVTGRGGP
jgi:hypothetical protein